MLKLLETYLVIKKIFFNDIFIEALAKATHGDVEHGLIFLE